MAASNTKMDAASRNVRFENGNDNHFSVVTSMNTTGAFAFKKRNTMENRATQSAMHLSSQPVNFFDSDGLL